MIADLFGLNALADASVSLGWKYCQRQMPRR